MFVSSMSHPNCSSLYLLYFNSTLRLFRAASAPIIVCTAVIKFFISCILWGEIKSVVVVVVIWPQNLTVFAKTCLQLTLRQSQWPGVF